MVYIFLFRCNNNGSILNRSEAPQLVFSHQSYYMHKEDLRKKLNLNLNIKKHDVQSYLPARKLRSDFKTQELRSVLSIWMRCLLVWMKIISINFHLYQPSEKGPHFISIRSFLILFFILFSRKEKSHFTWFIPNDPVYTSRSLSLSSQFHYKIA